MSLYPVKRDLIPPDWAHDPAVNVRLLIFHTAVSNAHGSGPPAPEAGLEWHFYIDENGDIWQRRDTGEQADANYLANNFAISCETWDGGDPEANPWTAAQADSIVALIRLAHDLDGIPLVRPASWDGSGVGYHRQFPEWDSPYHSCPGNTRAAQFDHDIWPRAIAPITPTGKKEKVNASLSNPKDGSASIAELRDDHLVWLRGIAKGSGWYNAGPLPAAAGVPVSMDADFRPDGTLDVSVRTDKGVTWVNGVGKDGGPFQGWYVPG